MLAEAKYHFFLICPCSLLCPKALVRVLSSSPLAIHKALTEEKNIKQERNISLDYFPVLAENGKMRFCIPETENFLILEYVDGQSSSAIDDSPDLNPPDNPKAVVPDRERATLNKDLKMSDISAFLEKVFQQNDLEAICLTLGFRYMDIAGERIGERAERLVAKAFDKGKEDILLKSIAKIHSSHHEKPYPDETLTSITNVIRKTVGRQKSMNEVDVLIVTGLSEELDCLLECTGSQKWVLGQDSSGDPLFKGSLEADAGMLTLMAASAPKTGGEAAAAKAGGLIAELKPRCLAMVGICAGRKGDVCLGDVIVAEKLFSINYGKLKKCYDNEDKLLLQEIYRDLTTHNLNPTWAAVLKNRRNDPIDWKDNYLRQEKPKSFEHQEQWFLYRLSEDQRFEDSAARLYQHPERERECPNWGNVLRRLESKKLISAKGAKSIKLTKQGRQWVDRYQLENPDGYEGFDPTEPTLHLGPIGSTSEQVQQDSKLFQSLEFFERKTLGVEMEGNAIGSVGEKRRIPVIVAKGVSDYADDEKNDNFHKYATVASVKFLMSFLKKHPIPER